MAGERARLLVYGVSGYTGGLVAREAAARGLDPVCAARDAGRLAAAAPPGAEARVAALDDAGALDRALEGVGVVLHCAGPFSRTSRAMADACLRAGAHYLDVTGEVDVFEALAARDAEARAAGVMLLPGVGFDVVPSDCLAAHVAARVPGAATLDIAVSTPGDASRGTLRTAIEALGEPMRARRGGRLVTVADALRLRVDFGRGPRECALVTWGDVSTAWHTTGVPDVSVWFEAGGGLRHVLRANRALGPVLRSRPVRRALDALVGLRAPGPDAAARARGRSVFWARAAGADGRAAAARLCAPEGYTLTVRAALGCAERALGGDAPPGFRTPAGAYGADFVLELDGCRREDVPA